MNLAPHLGPLTTRDPKTLTSMFWVIPKFLVAAMAEIVPVMTRVLVPGREIIRK